MKRDQVRRSRHRWTGLVIGVFVAALAQPSPAHSQPGAAADKPKDVGASSYDQIAPVLLGKESPQTVMARDKAEKAPTIARQQKLLDERYQLASRPDAKVTMSRGKPILRSARLPGCRKE